MSVISIYTDLTEYCRYLSNLSLITSTIQVTSPVVGANLSVALFRLDGYGAVITKTVVQTTATTYTVVFDLNKDTYDTLNIYRAKQGDYVIQVTDSVGAVSKSPMFAVSIVSVQEIRGEWCKGVTFLNFEQLEPRLQPQSITGVTVTETSDNHFKGSFSLTFTFGTPNTLSWGGGTAVNINGTAPQNLLLINSTQDFIIANVNPALLPTVTTSESLYIDNGRMPDSVIIDQVRRATSWVQQRIIAKLEPNIVDTDPELNGYCDEVAFPETYYRPRTYNKWLNFKLPYPRLLYPGDLQVTGYFNQTQTAIIPRQWLTWNEGSGIVELVPSASSTVMWTFYNSIMVMQYLFNYSSIPGFWHYRGTVGLRDLWNERAIVREAIAKKCAWELLNSAGSAYKAGLASSEVSRDGVGQAQNFTSSSLSGVYGAHFHEYETWLKDEIPRMKLRFGSLQYITI